MLSKVGAIVASVTLTVFCTSCFVSDKPLFPDRPWRVASRPVAPGHYMKTRVYFKDGVATLGRPDTVLLSIQGSTYVLTEARGGQFSAGEVNSVEAKSLQLFPFSNGKGENRYVAQISHRGGFIYSRVDKVVDGDGFSVQEKHCSDATPQLLSELRSDGALVRQENGYCVINDPEAVLYAIASDANFREHSVDVYGVVASDKITTPAKLGAKLSPFCGAAEEPQALSPDLGGDRGPDYPHWKIITTTNKPGASSDSTFAIEAVGNQSSGWGRIGMWNAAAGKLYCGGYAYMKVRALYPAQSIIKLPSDPATAIHEQCRKEKTPLDRCGSHEALISKLESRGYRIIAQGEYYMGFPDRTVSQGGAMTVMGRRGKTDTLFGLVTYDGGLTKVEFKYGDTPY